MIPRERFRRGRRHVPWSPWNIPLSLRPLYLSAKDLAATPVDAWTGRHGGLSFTASTTARPAWADDAFAGAYPGVKADGVANAPTAATTGLPTGTAPCVVAALVPNFAGAAGRLVSWGGTTSPTQRRIQIDSTAGLTFNVHGARQALAADITSLIAPAIIVATCADFSSGSGVLALRINGTEVARYEGVLGGTTGTTRARLFANTADTPGNFGAATLAELLIGTTWIERQIQQFEGYCAHAYPLAGIVLPDGHPYRSSAP